MSWWVNQEKSYWDNLGWEILDFYDDDVLVPRRIVRSIGKHRDDKGLRVRDVFGGGMVVLGTAMLIPGPVDVAMAAGGAVLFKHPAGAVVGLVGYNLAALAMIAGGTALIYS